MQTHIVRILKRRSIKATTPIHALRDLLNAHDFSFRNSIQIHENGTPARSRIPLLSLTKTKGYEILKNVSKDKPERCVVEGVYDIFEDYIISVRNSSDIHHDEETQTLYVCGYAINGVNTLGTLDSENRFDVHFYEAKSLRPTDRNTLKHFHASENDAIIFMPNAIYNSRRTEVILIDKENIIYPSTVTYPNVFNGVFTRDKTVDLSDLYDSDEDDESCVDGDTEYTKEEAAEYEEPSVLVSLSAIENLRLTLAANKVNRNLLLSADPDQLIQKAIDVIDSLSAD